VLSQKNTLYKMPLLVWAAFILVLSLMPPSSIPKSSIMGIDKVAHLIFYFVFVWFCMVGWHVPLSNALFLAVSYGIVIEILQHALTTQRQFDIYDIIANSLGALLYYVLKVFKSKLNSR